VTLPGVLITETTPAAGGTTIAIKDLFDTAGVRTTGGSKILAERVPTEDATVVRRLAAIREEARRLADAAPTTRSTP